MVRSQIVKLIFGPCFGHNLCFNYPDGSCEPILDIYILKKNQWYKKLFNPMGFDPCNRSLKIRKSIGAPTLSNSQSGNSLGSVEVHSLTLFHTPKNMKCDSQTSLLARTFTSLCLSRKPKAKFCNIYLIVFHNFKYFIFKIISYNIR
jgi:hypothetical protein